MATDAFELLREEAIDELNTRALLYRHRTGAELLSLINDDENKVFGISFRTPPADSTGIAHILEHAVLCGSRKYPVKEPFVELLKGSLNTFLNAFTFPDKTCYPVASQNLQDFYNLVDVYLDAVFYPLLTPQVLQQEGWHYELERVDDPLTYKGVVFNEMKGAYSSPERLLTEYAQHSLFPDTTYGVDSGGDPRHIPDLQYKQFEAFYKRFYHPSNAFIFFYGDDDPQQRFRLLEEYLGDCEPRDVNSAIAPQLPFARPRSLVHPYVVGQESTGGNKAMVTVNWLLQEEMDAETSLAFYILEHVLIGTPASPLRKALIDSGLGEDLAGIGLEDELCQFYLSIGLKGIDPVRQDAVEPLVFSTLEKLAEEGIEAAAIAAALNTVEFRLRENNTGSYPRGLALMRRALATWLYDRDPFAPMAFSRPLNAVKARLRAEERYFETLIRRHLLDNVHRTNLLLEPDPGLSARQETEEKNRLEQVRIAMSPEELEALSASARELKRQQEEPDSPEALATLPRLQLSDLDPRVKTVPLEVEEQKKVRVLYHDIFTNGIVYLDIGFDLHVLPQEYLPYIPLFGRALLEMGTEKEDFVKLAQRIGARTGGIWSQCLISPPRQGQQSASWFFLRGKAMAGQVGELLDILRDVLLAASLDDKQRFQQMVLEEKAGEEAGLVPGGHQVVNLRLRSHFDEADWVSEQMGGISYLFFLRQLVQDIEQDWAGVVARLENIRRLLLNREVMLCNVTLAGGDRSSFEPQLTELLEAMPAASVRPVTWNARAYPQWEGLTVPSQVNYVGKGGNLYELGYELHGSSSVVCRYLSTTWLWDQVRVQGGAYGAFCSFDHFTGVFSCTSYRDPNVLETLKVYDRAGRFLREMELSEDELKKAIIGTIGDLDSYQLPDAKGYTSMARYLTGTTDEFRQSLRDEVLGTQVADFAVFAEVLEALVDQGRVVILGSPEAIEGAGEEQRNGVQVVSVL